MGGLAAKLRKAAAGYTRLVEAAAAARAAAAALAKKAADDLEYSQAEPAAEVDRPVAGRPPKLKWQTEAGLRSEARKLHLLQLRQRRGY